MRYDPSIHHRRAIRLRGYDYAAAGCYFVTICTHGRELTLADTDAALVVREAWDGLADRLPGVDVDEFVVMPNHVHGIVILEGGETPLGKVVRTFKSTSGIAANRLLGRAQRSFWQRNYYERIIRSETELLAVRQYIRNNPLGWDVDPENPDVVAVRNVVGARQAAPLPPRQKRTAQQEQR